MEPFKGQTKKDLQFSFIKSDFDISTSTTNKRLTKYKIQMYPNTTQILVYLSNERSAHI